MIITKKNLWESAFSVSKADAEVNNKYLLKEI